MLTVNLQDNERKIKVSNENRLINVIDLSGNQTIKKESYVQYWCFTLMLSKQKYDITI